MKRIVLIIYSCIAALSVYAQKEDVKKLCSDYEHLILSDKTFHLPYDLTIASSMDTTVERVHFDLYKANDKDYLKMGESQIVIHDGIFLLVVNHEVRTIRMSNDSANLSTKTMLISDFNSIIDSSKAVTVVSKDGKLDYTFTFPNTYGYSKMELVFSKKTKHLHKIYVEFAADYPSEFKYIEVNYMEPDFKWLPSPNFPDTETYVRKANGQYIVQDKYDSYKIY